MKEKESERSVREEGGEAAEIRFENDFSGTSYSRLKVVGEKVGGMANGYILVAKRNWRKSTISVRAEIFYKLVLMVAALKIIFDAS